MAVLHERHWLSDRFTKLPAMNVKLKQKKMDEDERDN